MRALVQSTFPCMAQRRSKVMLDTLILIPTSRKRLSLDDRLSNSGAIIVLLTVISSCLYITFIRNCVYHDALLTDAFSSIVCVVFKYLHCTVMIYLPDWAVLANFWSKIFCHIRHALWGCSDNSRTKASNTDLVLNITFISLAEYSWTLRQWDLMYLISPESLVHVLKYIPSLSTHQSPSNYHCSRFRSSRGLFKYWQDTATPLARPIITWLLQLAIELSTWQFFFNLWSSQARGWRYRGECFFVSLIVLLCLVITFPLVHFVYLLWKSL